LRQRRSGCPMPELRQRRRSCTTPGKRQARRRFLLGTSLLLRAFSNCSCVALPPASGNRSCVASTQASMPSPCLRHVDSRCAACRPRLTAAQAARVERRVILARTLQRGRSSAKGSAHGKRQRLGARQTLRTGGVSSSFEVSRRCRSGLWKSTFAALLTVVTVCLGEG
jgi:hypothetical protein